MNIGDFFYRYTDRHVTYTNQTEESYLDLDRYKVVKITPKGCWIVHEYEFQYAGVADHLICTKKFILETSCRKFAWPTIEEAQNSFKIRKSRQIWHLERQLNKTKIALKLAQDGKWDERFKQFTMSPFLDITGG